MRKEIQNPDYRPYRILKANSETTLEKEVKRLMECGYEPIGGVSISCRFDAVMFFSQAMCMKSENKSYDCLRVLGEILLSIRKKQSGE